MCLRFCKYARIREIFCSYEAPISWGTLYRINQHVREHLLRSGAHLRGQNHDEGVCFVNRNL